MRHNVPALGAGSHALARCGLATKRVLREVRFAIHTRSAGTLQRKERSEFRCNGRKIGEVGDFGDEIINQSLSAPILPILC